MANLRNRKSSTTKQDLAKDSHINWVECSSCSQLDMYKNFNSDQPFSPGKVSKMRLTCRFCTLEQSLHKAIDEITVLKDHLRALQHTHPALSESSQTGGRKGKRATIIVTELVNISEENSQIKRLSPLQLKQTVDETQETEKR